MYREERRGSPLLALQRERRDMLSSPHTNKNESPLSVYIKETIDLISPPVGRRYPLSV
jgi:hypothetical protein